MPKTPSTPTALQPLIDLKNAYDERIKSDGKAAIESALKDFFKMHSQVSMLSWTQYTPHFNDGDACVFSVNAVEVRLGGPKQELVADLEPAFDGRSWDYRVGAHTAYHFRESDPRLCEDLKQLTRDFCAVEEAFRTIFGDGVRVIVHRSGKTEIIDYDHE